MTNSLQRMLLGGASLAGLAALCLTAPALAQTAPQPETPTAQDDSLIDRVVITAERREQDAQDVAIAATVLSGESLAEQGVNSLNDIQRVSPSIAINTFNRSTFVNIRGVGIAQSAPTSSPGVAYYIDGALVPHEQFIGQSFFDIGSVEVLRGPQGTLTGQNSTGGALYVRSPAPEFGAYHGYIEQTLGDYNWMKTQAAVNIPLGDIAALRAAVVSDQRDSFTTNIGASQSEPGDHNLVSARLNLEVRPDDAWTFNLRYENFDLQTDNNAVKRRNDTVSSDPFVIQEDARSFLNQSGYRLSGEVRWDVNDWLAVRYLLSQQRGTTKDQTDGDRTTTAPPRPMPPLPNNTNTGRVSFARTEFDTMIHEINLLSTDDGPLQWVVGAFYLDEDVPVDLLRDNTHTTDFVTTVRGSDIRTLAVNTSKSVFGQASYTFNPQWEAIAGLRYSEDEQVYTRIASPGGIGTTSAQSDEVTGRFALNFRPMDDVLVYASASKGYKAGGVNLTLADPNFEPETNQVYELGAKTTLMDGALQLNGAVFQSDYQDIQLASLRAGLPTTQNAASGEATGAEVELIGVLGNFEINAGLGWLDATFAEDACINNTNAPPGTDPGCSTGNRLVTAGSVLPFSPELTFNAGVQFDIEFGENMVLTPRVQFSRVSDQYATPFQSNITLVPERDLWDFRLTFQPTDNLVLEGFVQNATDEVYIASQIQNSSSADGGIIYGAPRMIGMRARIAFN